MNAGGGCHGGIVSGFAGGKMGGCGVGRYETLVGLVVGPGVGTITGAGGGRGGSTVGVGIGGGIAIHRVGKRKVRPERRTRGVTVNQRVWVVGVGRIGRGCWLGTRRDGLGRVGTVWLSA